MKAIRAVEAESDVRDVIQSQGNSHSQRQLLANPWCENHFPKLYNSSMSISTKSKLIWTLLCLLLPIVGFILYVQWTMSWDHSIGIFPFYKEIHDNISAGKIPWRDFDVEYPPLATYFLLGPVAFIKGLTSEQITIGRGLWSLLLTLFAVFHISKRELEIREIPIASLCLGLTVLLTKNLYFLVFDWLPMCLIVLALQPINKVNLSRAFLALGAFTKVVPGFIYFWLPFPRKDALKSHAVFIALLAAHVLFALIALPGTLFAIQYHSKRPIDAYSIYGTIAMTLDKLHLSSEKIQLLFGTESMVGPVSKILTTVSTVITLGIFIWLFQKYRKINITGDENRLAYGWLFGIATIMAYTTFGKLGQVNYCFWLSACVSVLAIVKPLPNRDLVLISTLSLILVCASVLDGRYQIDMLAGIISWKIILVGYAKFVLQVILLAFAMKQIFLASKENLKSNANLTTAT